MLINDKVYHFAEKRFFFYNGTFITESLHKRPNQSLASIHWLTYKPTVFGGGWFMSPVVGVCVVY